MDLATLVAIEEIRQLKGRYFRLMDQRLWGDWVLLFTEDVHALYEFGSKYGLGSTEFKGADQLKKGVSEFLSPGISVHQGFMPEIEVTSPTTARGTWAMQENLCMPTYDYVGYGHYVEDYLKEHGVWKIENIVLTRLFYNVTWREGFPAH